MSFPRLPSLGCSSAESIIPLNPSTDRLCFPSEFEVVYFLPSCVLLMESLPLLQASFLQNNSLIVFTKMLCGLTHADSSQHCLVSFKESKSHREGSSPGWLRSAWAESPVSAPSISRQAPVLCPGHSVFLLPRITHSLTSRGVFPWIPSPQPSPAHPCVSHFPTFSYHGLFISLRVESYKGML